MAEELNINQYIQFLRKNFKRESAVRTGFMYSYNYLFTDADDFEDKKYDDVKFYDFNPLTFVYEIKPKTKTFFGINFHHMPIQPRLLWLNRVKKLNERPFEKEGANRLFGMRYNVLKLLFKKSTVAVRQYHFTRVKELRIVPNVDWETVMNIYSRTYYGVRLNDIENRYRRFVPKI